MYHALYRKYRPVDFDSVVGQDSIIKTLKNSIINNNFSHAYMFFGPRGTGKTTVSKIFARNINCLSSIDGNACKKCDNCNVSFSKECLDIIEIDAASNNGVDEIRDLKNRISLVPNDLKFKVYIIDEVHMLSIGAFNALLKTLEEPPEHVIFILATTDPQKVPETIISRCQCFNFKKISNDSIKNRLEFVCKNEKIKIEDEVLNKIAVFSDGGLRDALGMLDKLVSYSNDKITMHDFEEINGIISDDDLNIFLSNLFLGNISEVLSLLFKFDTSGKNLIQVMVQLLNYCRDLLVNYYVNNSNLDFNINLLLKISDILNEKMFDIKKSSNVRIYVEMLFLKFINDFVVLDKKVTSSNISKDDVVQYIDDEKKVDSNLNVTVNVDNNTDNKEDLVNHEDSLSNNEFIPCIVNIKEIMDARVHNTLALANKSLLNDEKNNFEKLKDFTFDQNIGYIVCNLLDSKLRAVSSDNIIISFEFDSNVEQNLLIINKITDVYNNITSSNKKIAIISDSKWKDIKEKFILDFKNGVKYDIIDEPEEVLEDLSNNDIIDSEAMNLFGNVVEYE